jgi:hypothetical protein
MATNRVLRVEATAIARRVLRVRARWVTVRSVLTLRAHRMATAPRAAMRRVRLSVIVRRVGMPLARLTATARVAALRVPLMVTARRVAKATKAHRIALRVLM